MEQLVYEQLDGIDNAALLNPAVLQRLHHRLALRMNVQAFVNIAYVKTDRIVADRQAVGAGLIAVALG